MTWLTIPFLEALLDATLDSFAFFEVELLLILLWWLLAIISAAIGVAFLRKKRWVFSVASFLLPMALIGAVGIDEVDIMQYSQREKFPNQKEVFELLPLMTGPLRFLRPSLYVGDAAHFLAMKTSYDKQVAALPNDGARFAEFNWGGMLFSSNGVVYDQTDEIALPKSRRSAAWVRRFKNTDLMCGYDDLIAEVRPLWSHYYLAGFGC